MTRSTILLLFAAPLFTFPVFADCTTCSTPTLPSSFVSAKLDYQTLHNFYWQFTFSGVPLGYSVSNGGYQGWYADTADFFQNDATLPARLFSSYDPNMPAYDQHPYWDRVNWLINNKNLYPQANWSDFQNAIWQLLGQSYTPTTNSSAIFQAAIAKGAGFRPGSNQSIAIIVDPNFDMNGNPSSSNRHQVTFFELFCPLTQGYWKNHVSAWPLNTNIYLGSSTFNTSNPTDVAKLLAIFNSPVQGNVVLDLQHQLIAAELNIAAGVGTGPISATIAAAIPYAAPGSVVKPSSPAGQLIESLASTLDAFNSGTLPGVCAGGPTS